MTKERISALRKRFTNNYEAVIITNLNNVRYLCGYTGSNGTLLVTKKSAYFFTDFRYQEQCRLEINGCAEIVIIKNGSEQEIFNKINKMGIKNLGFEKSIEVSNYLSYLNNFKGEKLIPTENLVEELRQYKDWEEAKSLQIAFDIADKSLELLLEDIYLGMTEIEIAALLDFNMRLNGSEKPSFDTIVASGPNASCPHHQPTNRKIKKGDMLKIDFGATYNGYHSDMTRTFFIGKAPAKFKKIYAKVLEAQTKAIEAIKVGEECKKIDAIARKVITDAGYAKNFGHGLGHSFGLEIHEKPAFSPLNPSKIEIGHTYTVEPGIYIPDWGGIRIEDSFMICEDGLHKFTNFPNELIELDLPKSKK